MSTIQLSGSTNLEEKSFEFCIDIDSNKSVSIIGPNGAGKSTFLRVIGGHQPLRNGSLMINDVLMDAPTDRIFIPPHRRPVVLQHQNGGVFPHLSVQDNIAFPFRSRKCSKRKARTHISDILEEFDLKTIQTRFPDSLSGGQRSRVALARSVASNPDFLLLDEPCASLDVEATAEMHQLLRSLKTTLLIATHDPVETMKLTDFIIAVDQGEIIQQGSIEELTSNPATPWITKFLDLNLVSGKAVGYGVQLSDGGHLNLSKKHFGPVQISFPSSAIAVHTDQPTGSPRNRWEATVTSLNTDGDLVRIGLNGPFFSRATITNTSFKELGIELGSHCWASIKATELMVLPSMDPDKK
ncbi:MAG: ABC transporter ATP-binding protein [Actinomycetota bacterium]